MQPPYPPPPGNGYMPPRPAPQPPKKFPVWAIILITVGAAAVLVLGGLVVTVLDGGFGSPPKPTARVTGCNGDRLEVTIDYVLTNHDSRTHTYIVYGSVGHSPVVPDTLVGVAPGETAHGQMIALGAQGDCEITGVDQR